MRSWYSIVLAWAVVVHSARAGTWDTPWLPPRDAVQAATASDEYAWRLFVALNWPAAAHLRRADRHATLRVDRHTVWESWKSLSEVYLSGGRDPGPWLRTGGDTPASQRRFETLTRAEFPNPRHIVDGKMAPLSDPLARSKRLTEAHMNQIAYAYIRNRGLYSVEGQILAVQSARAVQFPAGAINVKATWRPITNAERARYHTTTVRTADGTSHLYGLTALHVASKDLPQWFWATFEHVDNPAASGGEGWLLPSRDAFACRGSSLDCNRAPEGIGLEGTVWQNYRLRGTQTHPVDDDEQPLLLANSELEAGDQRSSSCITCHSRSALAASGNTGIRLTIFEGVDDRSAASAQVRKGAIGEPRPEWFVGVDAGRGAQFHQLDFVWSLSKAQTRRGL